MNILFLVVKKEFFTALASGEKKVEYRDVTDYYIDRLCELDPKTKEAIGFKKFDAIQFQAGYRKDASRVLIECLGIELVEEQEGGEFLCEYFEITLGEVIEKQDKSISSLSKLSAELKQQSTALLA